MKKLDKMAQHYSLTTSLSRVKKSELFYGTGFVFFRFVIDLTPLIPLFKIPLNLPLIKGEVIGEGEGF